MPNPSFLLIGEDGKNTMTDTNQTSVEDVVTTNPQETVTEHTDKANEANIDYATKFSESSREALRLLEENRKKDAEIERLRKLSEASQSNGTSYSNDSEISYPGFENLGEDERKQLIAYTNAVKEDTLKAVYKDPAIAFAKETYNEKAWNQAFEKVAEKFPELLETKDEFKAKSFNPNNVPSNIDVLLEDIAKMHLFDKAQEIGAKRAMEQANRIDIERANGGDKTTSSTTSRTLEDWTRMAQTNPAEFAKRSKEFNEDMASGKLK